MQILSLLLLTLLLGTACTGKSASADLFTAKDAGEFTKFVNEKKMPEDPNLSIDKSVINTKYPIEIALYHDGKFFYDLPNLGTGKGKWKYKDGKIELRAHRTIFDMYIEVYGGSPDFKDLAIQFSDRHGAVSMKMENNNLL